MKASDIHIVPLKDKAVIQFRIDKDLLDIDFIEKEFSAKLVSHYKFLAGMDIGEKRRPQNGAINVTIDHHAVNLRFSTLPTLYEESLVIRVLPQEHVPSLKNLVLFPQTSNKLLSLMKKQYGLIVLTGPTGSGKTTTLYSLIDEARKQFNRKVITLEDPVEKRNDGFLQVQINEKAGITYSAGLKAILRHDPDIIMVGEIRDEETASAAIRAAYTGHLVLSSLHTGNALGALYRLKEFGIPAQDLEHTLAGIAAQRLVNVKCPYCESGCSPYCISLKRVNRLAICEILEGLNLKRAINEMKGNQAYYQYKKINDLIAKGIALGYLSHEEYGA